MILDELAAHAAYRVEQAKIVLTLEELREIALSLPKGGDSFVKAIARDGLSFICEVKRASPSKGIIDPVFDYMKTAADYVDAGADCVSCLTEPKWFLGSDKIFTDIRSKISLPMLRKDFTVDEYQLYEAKVMGAQAVLLICSLLDTSVIEKYIGICDTLGLSALVEAHEAGEIRDALSAGAKIIGVNNRNLKDFSVDTQNAARLRELVPPETLFVAESGISVPSDAKALREAGADALLIGEVMMRAADKAAFLSELREAAR
ncbi:MAG: indole-3-glycerol phosphate synthase TrpC [Eubacteriales bacterium]